MDSRFRHMTKFGQGRINNPNIEEFTDQTAHPDAMLPETRNAKRNEKRERYEKRCLEVSHVQETRREKE